MQNLEENVKIKQEIPLTRQNNFLSFKCPAELVARMDFYAKEIGTSRSSLARILISEGLQARGIPLQRMRKI